MKWLEWWYRLTVPPPPTATASFAQRESARRGRLGSTILFFLCLLLTAALPIGLLSRYRVNTIVIAAVLLLAVLALLFNRKGKSNISGLILTLSIALALMLAIRASPGGLLDPNSLGLFDLLAISEVFAASLLPVNWTFVVAVGNITFVLVDLNLQGRDAAFAAMMADNAYGVILRPVLLHILLTPVLWLWVTSATNAIKRADRAEVIATLEHSLAEQEHAVAEEKRVLDVSIQDILQTHIRVSNGDLDARVPLHEGATLWPIAVSLNNLLTRYQRLHQTELVLHRLQPGLQRARQIEHELQRTQNDVARLMHALDHAYRHQHPIQVTEEGTLLDPLVTALQQKLLLAPKGVHPLSSEHQRPAPWTDDPWQERK